jgi:Xaa-Pro aminopeptidase
MKRIPSYALILYSVFAFSPCFAQASAKEARDADGIRPEEYRQRRTAVMSEMDSTSVAIFRANDMIVRSNDVYYRFRQNSNFLYLTGINEPDATLILIPGGYYLDSNTVVEELLFIHPKAKGWRGESLGIEGAAQLAGIGIGAAASAVLAPDRLKRILGYLFSVKRILYYSPSLPEVLVDPVSGIQFLGWREVKKLLQEKYPNLEVKDPNSVLGELRVVKSPPEIALLQKAVDATVIAQTEAMKSCEPGMYEYQLQAVAEYCFARSGAEYRSFPSIVASGSNSLYLHYDVNSRKMKSDDLVIIDIGAEFHGYSADIARTIPVGGKFSSAQKDLYNLVLSAQEEGLKAISAGGTLQDVERRAREILTDGLLKMHIAKDSADAKKYSPHLFCHFIGLDVHDPGSVDKRLVPGMAFALEPGIYIPEESDCEKKYRGIGVRIEDDVLVTEEGYSVLSAFSPKHVDEIETLMKMKGIGNTAVGKQE